MYVDRDRNERSMENTKIFDKYSNFFVTKYTYMIF